MRQARVKTRKEVQTNRQTNAKSKEIRQQSECEDVAAERGQGCRAMMRMEAGDGGGGEGQVTGWRKDGDDDGRERRERGGKKELTQGRGGRRDKSGVYF